MRDENPFSLEVQIDAALQGKWGAHKRAKRRKKLMELLGELIPKADEVEADVRRAFNRWDKIRRRIRRVERELDKLFEEDQKEIADTSKPQ